MNTADNSMDVLMDQLAMQLGRLTIDNTKLELRVRAQAARIQELEAHDAAYRKLITLEREQAAEVQLELASVRSDLAKAIAEKPRKRR